MITDESIAAVAALFADPSRLAMLWALSDGRPRPAGELARQAHVTSSTASEHLSRLLRSGLVVVQRHGRHRYYRIEGPAVVAALEAMGALARPARPPDHGRVAAAKAVGHARSCYDHLAGALGVQVTQALVAKGLLILRDEQYEVPADAVAFLATALGVDVDRARSSRRQFAKACLDWTEREYHVAGALGAELLRSLISRGWLERTQASRALRVTTLGRRELQAVLGVDPLATRHP